MITKVVFALLFAAALVLLFTATLAALSLGRNPDTAYDVAAERTFEGMVTRTAHSIDGTMYFTLKTSDTDVEVQLGPRNFIEKSEFKLKLGERVTVIAAPSMAKEREVLLAREIRCSRGVFTIRDRNGGPMWDLDRPIQMDPDRAESVLCEMILP
jgi:hypothetical protein